MSKKFAATISSAVIVIAAAWLVVSGTLSHWLSGNSSGTAIQAPAANSVSVTATKLHFGLQQLFQPKMLGAQISDLESSVGHPTMVEKNGTRNYEVDGCQVSVRSDGKIVQSLKLMVSNTCTVSLDPFVKGLPSANKITFGALQNVAGPDHPPKFLTDCIRACDSIESILYLYWQDPTSSTGLELSVGALLVPNNVIEAADKYQAAVMAKAGARYLTDARFNCDSKYDAIALKEMHDVAADMVEVGYHIKPVDKCGAGTAKPR